MVLDYKDTSFSFDTRRRKKRLRRLRLIGLLVVVTALITLWSSHRQTTRIRQIEDLLLQNRVSEARQVQNQSAGNIFHKNQLAEVTALIELYSGNLKAAESSLQTLGDQPTAIRHGMFLNHLAEQAEYRKMEIYLKYLRRSGRDPNFYRALIHAALFRPAPAQAALERMSESERQSNSKAVGMISAVNTQIESGRINFIFDRNGKPLAYYDVKRERTVSKTPGLSFKSFTASLQNGLRFYTLTIDLKLQRLIDRVFSKYSGSMLVLNLEDGGIAAAFSKPLDPDGKNPVFMQQYEPGSTMKVLTMYSYLAHPDQTCYPVTCRGLINLGKQVFYDRLPHGVIQTPEKALAISCNIAFAKMGLLLGIKKLSATYDMFLFNSPPLKDRFLSFHLGRVNSLPDNGYRLANLSVGLNEVTVTTFHSALIPAFVAQQGSIYKPHMIKVAKNVLNLGFYNHSAETFASRGESRVYADIQKAMNAVVEDPSGTGRRSRIQFIRTAVKTGTAGEKSAGFDAVMIGFFPMKYPRFAFAFRLQGGGKAEFNAAYLLKAFLTEWRLTGDNG